MDRYKETFETWNKIALLYQDKFMHLDLYNETYDFICASIPKENASILEIGCGPGNICKFLLNKRPDYRITGIDIAPDMIALAKKNNPTASFEVMDSREIGGLDKRYDGIVSGFCLPYLSHEDSKPFLKDCYTLLTDNGFIYLSFVEGYPDKSGFQVSIRGDRSYFYFYHLNDLIKQFNDIGFIDLKVFKVEYINSATVKEIHTILTAKKNISNII